MFRVSQYPSSGLLKTVPAASGTGHTTCTATPLQRGLIGAGLCESHATRIILLCSVLFPQSLVCRTCLTVIAKLYALIIWNKPYDLKIFVVSSHESNEKGVVYFVALTGYNPWCIYLNSWDSNGGSLKSAYCFWWLPVPASFLVDEFGVAPKSNCHLDEMKVLSTRAKNNSQKTLCWKKSRLNKICLYLLVKNVTHPYGGFRGFRRYGLKYSKSLWHIFVMSSILK